jgi:tripartite-type tricarboxylate transporter receptor subunit TctC
MNPTRASRSRRAALGVALSALCLAWPAAAQQPPLRILVGFPAGGSTDAIARHLAQGLSEALQRSVFVENKPGAGGQLAANALKAAAPDGHTLFLSNSHALAMIPLTIRQPGYDPARDFVPVGLVAISNDVLGVNPQVVGDVRTLRGLVDWAQAHPDKGSVGVPAAASDPEFGVLILAKEFKARLTAVPYRGDGPVVQDLVAGQIPAGMGSIGAMMPYVKSGKLRVVAISGPQRLALLPDVPTYAEQGLKGYGVSGFVALVAPTGTPRELLQRYNAAVTQIVRSEAFSAKVADLGVIATPSTPEELATRIRETSAAFAAMVERADYKMP